MLRGIPSWISLLALALASNACGDRERRPKDDAAPIGTPRLSALISASDLPTRFPADLPAHEIVGAKECQECHAEIYQRWAKSAHGRAMALPSEQTIVADFDNSVVTAPDGRITLVRDGPSFLMRVDEGERTEQYRVDLVLGAGKQHQAYFTRRPDGAYSLLPVFWSTVKKIWLSSALAQPGSLDASSSAHWANNAVPELRCFNCHLSQLQTSTTGSSVEVAWGDLPVNCEACHGPGREHVRLRRAGAAKGGEYRDLHALGSQEEVALCAECHAFKWPYRYNPSSAPTPELLPITLADRSLRPDGTQSASSYQYAGHVLSGCYRLGALPCSACHDPHSQHARSLIGEPAEGAHSDRQCTVCHRNYLDPAAALSHSHHRKDVRCIDCHMALSWITDSTSVWQRTSDHSISIPHPAETRDLGTPNACTTCHEDRDPGWALDALERWGQRHATETRPWVRAIWLGRRRAPGAVDALSQMLAVELGDYARASALELLSKQPADPGVVRHVGALVDSPNAAVRGFALAAAIAHDENPRQWAQRAAGDSHPFVRILGFQAQLRRDIPDRRRIAAYVRDIFAYSEHPPVTDLVDLVEILADRGHWREVADLLEIAEGYTTDADESRWHLDQLRRRANELLYGRSR